MAKVELGTLEHSTVMIPRVATCEHNYAKSRTLTLKGFSGGRPVKLLFPQCWDNNESAIVSVFRDNCQIN